MIPNNPDEPSPGGARHAVIVPIGLLVLVLLPLLLMPLAAIFVFAFRGGLTAFLAALSRPTHIRLALQLLIAFGTAGLNAVLGTFTAYVLSKYRFPGERPLGLSSILPGHPDGGGGHLTSPFVGADRALGPGARQIRPATDVHPHRGAPGPPLRGFSVYARRGQNRCSTNSKRPTRRPHTQWAPAAGRHSATSSCRRCAAACSRDAPDLRPHRSVSSAPP